MYGNLDQCKWGMSCKRAGNRPVILGCSGVRWPYCLVIEGVYWFGFRRANAARCRIIIDLSLLVHAWCLLLVSAISPFHWTYFDFNIGIKSRYTPFIIDAILWHISDLPAACFDGYKLYETFSCFLAVSTPSMSLQNTHFAAQIAVFRLLKSLHRFCEWKSPVLGANVFVRGNIYPLII